MGRKFKWTPDKYRVALQGRRGEGVEGLRALVKGFDSADGYNLNKIDKWTASQKRRVRDYFQRVEQLEAQPKLIVRKKSAAVLKKLQDSFHGDIPSSQFKVAFVPYHEPKVTLPGAKKRKPRVRVTETGVSIQTKQYERVFVPFDQRRLVKAPRAEIARAAKAMPGAALYFTQVGDNQTLHGKSLELITRDILLWMEQYDGKRALPAGSGNKGDDPRHHHWKYWLNGLVGYVLPRGANIRQMGQLISEGRKANDKRKQKLRNLMKRKGR